MVGFRGVRSGGRRDAVRSSASSRTAEGCGAPFYDVTLAGAELPLIRRGGSLTGSVPAEGVEAVSRRASHRLAFGYAGDATGNMIETRRLVELEGVDVLIGPNTFPNTLAVAQYAEGIPIRPS